MSGPSDPGTSLDRFITGLEARDRDAAVALVRALRAGGTAPQELITELLAPAQQRVGELWQTGVWNVAQEHAASAIVDAVLSEIELHSDAVPTRGTVVVTCAEGEWHVLPARMLAEQLRQRGWSVTFLGGSTPAVHLERFLASVPALAVAVSCTVAIFLPGAQRSIEAAHRSGLPALAGGAGFGGDDRRAGAIGADGWAPTASAADQVLTAWARQRPPLRRMSSGAAAMSLAAVRGAVVDRAFRRLTDRFPAIAHYDQRQVDQTREDLDYILQFLEAALLTADATVLDDFLPWLERVLTSRNLPTGIVPLTLDALAGALPPDQLAARSLLGAR